MRIGITGHSNLAPQSIPAVASALREVLSQADPPLVGVTCLARGADQVFARVVLELGGQIEVVLPAADYRERKVKPDNRDEFEGLLAQAGRVEVLAFDTSGPEAYMEASETVLATVERIVAVWDGCPANGHGGTGDVVAAAREHGIPVTTLWPDGTFRI